MQRIEEFLTKIVGLGNTIFWDYILIYLLIGAGIYFTLRSNFVQLRLFPDMFRVLRDEADEMSGKRGTNSFQAFSISIASRVGTGNLTGVALAVAVGGPGAVFWMWVIAFIGMATAFIESTLAQVYKIPDKDGFRGGPAYYIEKALGQKWMAILFSLLIMISFGLIFNAVQANTISMAMEEAFDLDPVWTGIVLVILTSLIIFGGINRIAVVSGTLVPIMAIVYILVALYVVAINIGEVPGIFLTILTHAFGIEQVIGGSVGVAIMQGIKRGLFSNEAGMGSAPNAAATAGVNHPAKQGLVQSLAVFFDTIVICSCTAFSILLFEEYREVAEDGIQLTQAAFSAHIGAWASIYIAIVIFLLAFSSVIGNYYYGESNVDYLKSRGPWKTIYRLAVLGMVMFGSLASIDIVWSMADLFMALMAVVNLIAILLIGNVAFAVLKDYTRQRKQGVDPTFHISNVPGLKNVEWWGAQDKRKE
ncbi:alanine/glycine:cation symporter family protein [Salirhabdus sp. Marseille-P4669]|uniref:alanine/glycine:cation symporter family protein n=1 Tax=Salirhabdus sp. Marseille-P4669 TaxID=2042310 RepID=UPI000C7BFD01|nr:alanine/glycine:cation symporter family protein [Salirhabdus sp. Marseille-P4669]